MPAIVSCTGLMPGRCSSPLCSAAVSSHDHCLYERRSFPISPTAQEPAQRRARTQPCAWTPDLMTFCLMGWGSQDARSKFPTQMLRSTGHHPLCLAADQGKRAERLLSDLHVNIQISWPVAATASHSRAVYSASLAPHDFASTKSARILLDCVTGL